MDRRNFIRVIGGGAVVAAGAGLTGCSEGPDPTAAWVSPGSPERDVRRYALAHAILAPNPHNRQPWLARLDGETDLTLFIDRSRLLPATDPFSRQIVIGCGAFLELLSISAGLRGYVARVTPFPNGQPADHLDDRPFAHVGFIPFAEAGGGDLDPLFRHILRRRTSRDPFDTERPIPAADLAAIQAAGMGPGLRTGGLSGGAALAAMRTLTREAYEREVDTPAANQESVNLMRIGAAEVAEHRDGISLTGPSIEAMKLLGLLDRKALATPGTMAFKQARAYYDPLSATAQAFVWIISQGNDRLAQIAAGRAYGRLTLEATGRDVALQPMSQALQEYPQMAPFVTRMNRLVQVGEGARLQMLVRAGYAKDAPPSPRQGLDALFRKAPL